MCININTAISYFNDLSVLVLWNRRCSTCYVKNTGNLAESANHNWFLWGKWPRKWFLWERAKWFCSRYLLMIGNKGKTHKKTAKESIYATNNQMQCSVRFIKRKVYGTLAHRLKRQEKWVDRWSMEKIKRTHPSPRPPPVTSNSQCCTSIIIKHKEIATFPSSILHHLLKKVNRKVQGVPQAQIKSNTMMAGSKNTQDKDMSYEHNKKHAGLKHARLTHACHDSPSKRPLNPKMWYLVVVLSWKYFKQQTKFYSFKIISTGFFFFFSHGVCWCIQVQLSLCLSSKCRVQNTVIELLSSETKNQYPTLIFGWIDFHFVTVNYM